ncbi:adventurous gliding motility protein GltG [Stigmatella erecta]|uniref:FHA domain protein n=1 Tax=Stigmatella erecta TaxID=83460 RepID=A0A1I0JCI9_9BACT|nr:adventurous gliding motility protein GltG [Stigmatella erecta]SEU07051.1 FHA domain protein [Stigmatella erecta]
MAVPLTLKVFKNETLVSSKDFDRDIIKIGRLSSAHLCLEDEKVSRIHSVIEAAADGSLSIIDMGSVEGTYVNGKRVNKGRIAFGDEIRVGGTTIRLENPAAMAAVNLAAAVSGTESAAAVAAAPAPIAEAPLASSLAQAAVAPEAAPAVDASFLATQKQETLQPQVAEPAAPVERVRTVRRSKSNGPLGVSLRFMWGDQRVGEFLLAPGKKQSFTVGSAAGVNFVMGDSKLESPRMEVMRTDGQSFTLLFTGKMKGELVRKDETLDLKGVIESGKASNDGGMYGLTLESEDFCWVDLGGVTLEVSFQPVPKKVHVPFADSVDYRTLNIFLLTFFAGTMFVISAANRSGDGEAFADELAGNNARLAKLIIKPPETQKNKFLEKLNQQKAEKEKKKSGELAAKQKKDEGQMGKKDEVKTNNRTATKDKTAEAKALTQKIFGGKGGAAAIFGSAGLGGDLKNAMGNMFGAKAGVSGGFGGLGIRGSGGGGGGTGDTVGIGGIGTKGRGGGTASYGSGVGVLGGKQSVDVGITSSEPLVMGSLDKELIRQVIQRNRSQIRFCYESQLTKYPKLGGKVAVKFVINAEGRVVSSDVAQSTAGNAELESCVAGRVRTWQFPKPKGGGVVIVTCPFIFKQSGD